MEQSRAQGMRLQSIRQYLLLRIVALVLFAVVSFVLVAYVLVLRPAQDERARVEMRRSAAVVETDVTALIGHIQRVLGTCRDFGRNGLYRFDRPLEFAKLLIPIINVRPQISNILVADTSGRSMQIARLPDGTWLLRETDVERLGTLQRQTMLSEAGTYVGETTVDAGFDPRTRPWFEGAMQLRDEAQVDWTAPYRFFGRSEIGMSASMRWTERDGSKSILSFDVLLADLSKFSSGAKVGEHGRAAILDVEGRMLGMPRDDTKRPTQDLMKMLFRTPREGGFPVLAAAYDRWLLDGRPEDSATLFRSEGEGWIARFAPLAVQDQRLVIASYAPRGDFQLGTRRDLLVLGLLLALSVVLAFFLARRFSLRFGGIIDRLVQSSERIGDLKLDAPLQVDTGVRELARLVAAQERMRTLLLDATRGLEAKVAARTSELAEREQALTEALERQNAIFSAAPYGIAVFQERKCVLASPSFERIFGYPAGEFVGRSSHELFASQEDFERIGTELYPVIARGDTYDYELRLLRKGGKSFWCRVIAARLAGEGAATRIVALYQDVSDEHAAAEALKEAKRVAEEATRAKSMFLASMTHEIRTPMNGLLGMLQILGVSRLDADQRSTLSIVHESALSLLRIIDDVLDFSKIEAGRLEIRREPASIASVVEGVKLVYSSIASAKDLLLHANVDPALSPALSVDTLRLRQILNNFVSNAIKFTEKGEVEIRAALAERRDGREVVRFLVRDTGIGVSKEAQAHLFQPYVQAAADTAHRFGGTGLGLTICRRLADMMEGEITMESEPGKGTTMSLTLSLAVADVKDLPKPTSLAPGGTALAALRRKAPDVEAARAEGALVLVAEDHPVNRTLITRLLGLLGYASVTAHDGREALEKWHHGGYGAVVTDCNMPEMDGYELARAIRAKESGKKRIPIIACTANALADELERCTAAGMDDFVAKPVELERLAKVMEQWLPLPSRAGETSPVNAANLAEVSGGDAAMEREILADFRAANQADMAKLRDALGKRDMKGIAQTAHRVKGACRTVGAAALAEVCERVEGAAKRAAWQAVAAEQRALELEFERLDAWLAA